ATYHLHRGALQASPGFIREVDTQSLYVGAGARVVGAETIAIPGIRLFAHLGDAYYEPLAALQRVAMRGAQAQAVQNDTLRNVTTAYFELIGAETWLEILRKGDTEITEVVRLTDVYAARGQRREGDADRARGNAELLRGQIRRAEEAIAVASARLC